MSQRRSGNQVAFHLRLKSLGILVAVCSLETLIASDGSPGTFRFIAERVDIDLRSESVCVTGEYVFLGHELVEEFPIFYPFHRDEDHGSAELLRATIAIGVSKEQDLRVFCAPDGCHFVLPSHGQDTCTVRLTYRQSLSGSRAVYVLKSTGAWKAPLDRAEFHLRVEKDLVHKLRINYPFRRGQDNRDAATFLYVAEEFLPARDLELAF